MVLLAQAGLAAPAASGQVLTAYERRLIVVNFDVELQPAAFKPFTLLPELARQSLSATRERGPDLGSKIECQLWRE
jgi:hypothetical protein